MPWPASPAQTKVGRSFSSLIRKPSNLVSCKRSRASGSVGTADPLGSWGQRLRPVMSYHPSLISPIRFYFATSYCLAGSAKLSWSSVIGPVYSNGLFFLWKQTYEKPNDLPKSPAATGTWVRISALRRPPLLSFGGGGSRAWAALPASSGRRRGAG